MANGLFLDILKPLFQQVLMPELVLACDSECDGICEMDEWSGSVGLTLKGEMGYQDGNEYTETGIEDVYIEY
ncbi:MAG: hypothetical protein IPH42_10745 [Bacteroidetes bacterium]|nr:hypothetical protein [Bacteroidota bacterium]